ncbi:MAG: flagellar hook protein FlgE [Acidobacteriota bacterium]
MGTFQTALSALKASATAIDAVGNNLANINTTGFKRSDVAFQELIKSVGGSPAEQTGGGVGMPSVSRQFSQGSVGNSGNALDAAIQGNGMFVINSSASTSAPGSALEYTRDGRFHVSPGGLLVTASGAKVQGWNVDPTTGKVDTAGALTDISIPVGTVIPAVATTSFDISANLDASSAEGKSLSIPLQIFDSLGGGHQFTLKATRSATANTWDLTLSTTDPTVQDGADLSSKLSVNSLSFVNGVLDPATAADIKVSGVQFTAESGISDLAEITWNVWKTPPAGTPPAGGLSGFTQFSQASAISALTQNGSPAGTLSDVRIGTNGKLIATFTNGLESQIGQIALAVVQNPDSLLDVGNNAFRATADTSLLPPGEPGLGAGGSIVGHALESSNVDIAQEFTNLITYQRSYQASSKVITTLDQLTMETLNLKQ